MCLKFLKTNYMVIINLLEAKLSAKQKQEWASCLVNIFEKSSDLSVIDFFLNVLQADLHNLNCEFLEILNVSSHICCLSKLIFVIFWLIVVIKLKNR